MKYLVIVLVFCHFCVHAQIPCVDGYAGGYPCENVDLMYHIGPTDIGGAQTNEVWGWTDPLDNKEYLLLGTSTGVYFYDLSIPTSPSLLGRLPTHTINSAWRTLRTYMNHVFICSEAAGHGMQVFDLTRLRNVVNPPEIFTEDAHYASFGKCHTLAICEETGFAYACGTDTYSGGIHIVNIQNPMMPVIAGGYDSNGYTHESLVVVYDGPDQDYAGQTIAFCFNGNVELPFTIVNVTDPTDATTISTSTYPNKRYCHQGWLTSDGAYMVIDDELDEYYQLVDSTHTILWDMHNLDAPVYMGFHIGGTSIDHNQIIVGNLDFQSNYTAGLSILDVTNIADTSLNRVAFFDHYPVNDNRVFQGEWMSYPFFDSGVVPVTDLYNGAFILKPNFIEVVAPELVCSNEPLIMNLNLKDGFIGPYDITIIGLPDGITAVYNLDGIAAPAELTISFNGTFGFVGNLDFEVTLQGLHHHYSRNVSVLFADPIPFYADDDGDGFGDELNVILTCVPAEGYAAVFGDCNTTNPTVYPDAPGTLDGIDNNCNNVIDVDEMAFCADLNADLIINVSDIQILMGDLNCTGDECLADLNNDGMTGLSDLLILIADFGEECP